MDITDTCCQHVHTEISDHLAFVRICALALSYNAVFLSADGAYLCLQRHSLLTADLDQFFGLSNILFDWILGAVKHDRCESGLDTLLTSIIGTVVKMCSYRNSNTHLFNHRCYHILNCLESGHVLSCTLGYT